MDNSKIIETYDKIKNFISKEDIYINEPMSKHTTFKIGGNADIFIKLRSIEQIEKIVKLSRKINEPLKIIGNGSNILVKDNGIRGIVAKVCTNSYEFVDDETIKVDEILISLNESYIDYKEYLNPFYITIINTLFGDNFYKYSLIIIAIFLILLIFFTWSLYKPLKFISTVNLVVGFIYIIMFLNQY